MVPDRDDPAWVDDVLRFWFEEVGPEAWFRKSASSDGEAFDALVRSRFLAIHEHIAALGPYDGDDWRTALASILVLDQFPRNMFRGTGRAFATDALARDVARLAVERRLDEGRTRDERLFFYLPFEHSEIPEDQDTAVRLIGGLGDAELTRYAVAHKVIIDRFGRFPHRNEALGRLSTDEEIAFLREPGSSF